MLEEALVLHQKGQLARAQTLYRLALDRDPANAEALHLLGLIEIQLGDFTVALGLIEHALALSPDNPFYLSNRGAALLGLHRFEEARASCDRALAITPDYQDALNNRAIALGELCRFEEALADYDRALAIQPGFAQALCNRGEVLVKLKRFEEALASCDQALALAPEYPEAYNNRGNALIELGRFEEALSCLDRALLSRPNFASALNSRGIALTRLKRIDDAILSYDRAIAIKSDFAAALINRGNILSQLNRFGDALVNFEQALASQPGSIDAWLGRGIAQLKLGRTDDALTSFKHTLALKADLVAAHLGKGDALQLLGRVAEAQASFAQALSLSSDTTYIFGNWLMAKMRACEWEGLADAFGTLEAALEAGEPLSTPFPVLATPLSAAHQKLAAEAFCNRLITALPSIPRRRGHARRIRLAYLSSDLCEHAVARAIAPLIEAHDRAQFEVIAFSLAPAAEGPMRLHLKKACDQFIDVHAVTDDDVVGLARRLEIDIAIDLNGFTGSARPQLFAKRAAPVQVSFIGYPGTTGNSLVDYKIADATVIPEDMRVHFTEKIVTLPHSYLVTGFGASTQAPSRQEAGLPEAGFVFCCFNNSYKILPDVFDVWMRLLRQTPASVLWLVDDNSSATANLWAEAEKRGVTKDRLIFAPRMDLRSHLARLPLADLFLDTFSYNAHTTALAMLWAGVPVVTKLGDKFAARVGGSLLNAIGLPELICGSIPDYEAVALKLANDAEAMRTLRDKLARHRQGCPLFDVNLYARHVEAAFKEMWRRNRVGLPADHITITARI